MLDKFTFDQIQKAAKDLKVNWDLVDWDLTQLEKGMNVELEHTDLTGGDPTKTAMIAIVHLNERPDYYQVLEKVEKG